MANVVQPPLCGGCMPPPLPRGSSLVLSQRRQRVRVEEPTDLDLNEVSGLPDSPGEQGEQTSPPLPPPPQRWQYHEQTHAVSVQYLRPKSEQAAWKQRPFPESTTWPKALFPDPQPGGGRRKGGGRAVCRKALHG